MYFRLDESLGHSSLNFLLELAMQLRNFIMNFAGLRVDEVHAKFGRQICGGYNIIYANYLVLLD